MTTGAELIATQLRAQGVSWISTLCGNGLNPLYDACRRAGIRVFDTHNEQAAAYMADGYARLTGRLAVCAVSSGIAHCNALTGVANAWFDGAPVLLITGASEGFGSGRGVFQEIDQPSLAAPICKLSKVVNRAADLPFQLREAITTAIERRPGPVHLTISEDILRAKIGETRLMLPLSRPPPTLAGRGDVKEVAETIHQSERPFLITGTGLFRSSGHSALIGFVEEFSLPFGVPIWDRGCVEESHPNFMGVLGAASGGPLLLADADLVITAGATSDYRVGFLSPPMIRSDARIVRIGSDPSELAGGPPDQTKLAGDPAAVLRQLSEEGGRFRAGESSWVKECRRRLEEFRSPWKARPSMEGMTGWDVVEAIRPLLSGDVVFLIDGGNIGQWAHMCLVDRYPSNWLTCGASAVVGWGIPGAMAARVAYPERPVLLLSGDGAFGFTIAELESAVRQNLPFVAVVANDSAWGIVVCGQRKSFGGTVASETGEIRFDKVAEGLGAKGLRVTTPKELTRAIETGFDETIPTVIDVPIQVLAPSDVK